MSHNQYEGEGLENLGKHHHVQKRQNSKAVFVKSCIFAFGLLLLQVLPGAVFAEQKLPWQVQMYPPEKSLIVLNDGNNLRQWGGKDYAKAPIVAVLNAWDEVMALRQDGRWDEVQTVDGRHGFVNAACLAPYRDIVSGKKAVAHYDDKNACVFHRKMKTRFVAVLDGGGQDDVITLRCEPWRGNARMFMTITGNNGRVRYQSPAYGDSRLIFFMSDSGLYWPELVGDIDQDGKAELVALHEPSDDRVSGHTFMRWNGQGFDLLKYNVALIEDGPQSGMFAYGPNPEGYAPDNRGSITEFRKRDADGRLEAVVIKRVSLDGTMVTYRGKGLFTTVHDGFKLERWIEPLVKVDDNYIPLAP